MDFGSINIVVLMVASTPILLAALGEMVTEKSGVLNLGVEGMMITGAVCGFIAAVETGSPTLGFLAAALGGATLSMLFGLLTQVFLATQVPAGLALTLVGTGLASLLGQNYQGRTPPRVPDLDIPVLEAIPVLGPILFRHDAIVYLSLLSVIAVWAFLKFTRAGLILRAVGENHAAAHALGYKVKAVRLAAIGFGGAMAGLGGAYISLVRVPQWTDGITAGIGWIALAIVVFASWRAGRVLIGAYLFGGITVLQLNLQAAGARVPVELLSMSPFLATILVLVVISARRHGATNAPAMLGRVFHAS
ncbi:ABC transporter permease [Celeribacter indicus]|uniref:Sugar ABC transporter permease n=1 Tax=Celeribacter indicus TaxID=1208324 RepID=A0A0B5E574_9RHOB|nr:ABC transporter permease [Celeribacter indicus]AJE48525.1 sugar ABC transporter permease [Celeribacter indicus]SDX07757.1 nucleoside ABC transporter membrane protein [Celeribacter indicus]